MFNLLIGGAAGQGIETTTAILQKFLKDSGYYVFSTRDVMSRVRGGHNFALLRFGTEQIFSHSDKMDGIIAFNQETIDLHIGKLQENGFVLCDSQFKSDDPRTIKLEMTALAKELGNPRITGSIAVGAILKLFGVDLKDINKVLKEYIKEDYFDVNIKAVMKGFELLENRYLHAKSTKKELIILSGNQALSLGAIAAGIKFYSAYPMSPSTSIMEYLASKGEAAGIVVEQAEDEISAINMAIGASFAGATAMTGTSGGGFCLMVEALGLSGIAEIPLVAVDVQRPGPATGLPTRTEQSDLKFVISASQGEFPRMVIALRNHIDAFYQTARAFQIAQKYQIPVIILSDQYLSDTYVTVEPYDLSKVHIVKPLDTEDVKEGEYLRYKYNKDGISPRLIPGKTKNFVTADSDEHDEYGRMIEDAETRIQMVNKRMSKLTGLREELLEPEFIGPDEFDTLLLGWGSTYGPIAEAVNILNKAENRKYAALIFGDIYPLPQKLLREKTSKTVEIINIEQNATGQLGDLIREKTSIVCTSSILKYDGRQISAEDIVERIRKGEVR